MSFEKIGPYQLSRLDQFMSVPVLSLFMLEPAQRLMYWILYTGSPLLAAVLALTGDDGGAVTALLLLWVLIVFSPALRARTEDMIISPHADGIEVATSNITTIYHWSTIGAVRQFGPRLLIMVTPKCALILPAAVDKGENLARLVSTIAEHKGAT